MKAKDKIFITQTMKRHGYTQRMVADAMGCSLQNLQYLTRSAGENTSLGSLLRIAEVIGITDLREFFTPPEHVGTVKCPKCGEDIQVLVM